MKDDYPFKVGDLVRNEYYPEWGIGRVVEIDYNAHFPIKVKFQTDLLPQWARVLPHLGHVSESLTLAETPIERMKRLYSEE